ncbi:hypothetical protein OGATHE_000173 [Ogataea polymorpha]|uniref:TATA-binding protein interacting (TIP20) domain-containing protein n=1 Tax=Ogataea polymorpha TaxID=460523 RepID=A0A9P8PUJ6_9ASCO|nr:hypothetical protein OGATHE_000173 [Ogataea polymorpha]
MRFFIEDLFTQTRDTDPDLRFMALNDLEKEILSNPDSFSSEARIQYAKILLHCLDDEFPEVRTQALKCFETLTPRLGGYVVSVVAALSKKKPEKVSITSTIYTMAIHNVLKNFVANESVARDVANYVLGEVFEVGNTAFYTTIDYIEIVTDLIEYLGKYLTTSQLNNIAELLANACYAADIVIAKKSVLALGLVARNFTSVEQLQKLISLISKTATHKQQETTLKVLSNLVRSNAKLMAQIVPQVHPTVLNGLYLDTLDEPDDDFDAQQETEETRAEALGCLVAMFECLPMEEHVSGSLELAARFIGYNPYKDDAEEELEEEDEYELSDLDDDDDDDGSGLSWKLRRESARLVSVILEKHPLALTTVFQYVFEPLLGQLQDDNGTVVSEVLRTLTKIFRFSVQDGPYYTLKFFNSLNDYASGRRGSDVSMQSDDDPSIYLGNKSADICEAFGKLLVTKNSSKLSLLYDFFVEFSNATDGCEAQWTPALMNKLLDLRESSITSEVIKFYAAVLKKYSLTDLGSSSRRIVADIVGCVASSSNHELVLETLGLLTDMLEHEPGAQLPSVEKPLIEKASNKNYSTEIRQKALLCLCSLVTKSEVLDLQTALKVFVDTITVEFLVAVDLHCIETIVSRIPQNLSSDWYHPIVLQLVEYLTISELQAQSLNTLASLAPYLDEKDGLLAFERIVVASEAGKIASENAVCVCMILSVLITKVTVPDVDRLIGLLVQFSKAPGFDQNTLADLTNAILGQKPAKQFIDVVLQHGTHSDPNVSKILGLVSVSDKNFASIEETLQNLNNNENVLFSITFLDQVSKSMDLDVGLAPFVRHLGDDEEIKNAAISAIATIVSRNPEKYLNELTKQIEMGATVPILHALKTALQNINLDTTSSKHLFNLLLKAELEKSDAVEATAAIIAFLAIHDSLLPEMCSILSSSPSRTQKLVLGSTTKQVLVDPSLESDLILLSRYLELTSAEEYIFSGDLELKQLGVSNLIFALHKKPLVALPLVSKIMPRLLETELEQKKEYVEVVRIGPFKHKLDKGLNYRKGLYEMVYSLLTTLETNPQFLVISQIDWGQVFEKFVARAFKDDPTVIFICLLTLIKIISLKPTIFAGNQTLENFIAACSKVLDKKLKDDAPKQELEKRNDTVRAVLRCCKKINTMVEAGQLKLDSYSSWSKFVGTLKTKYPIFDIEE